MIEMGLPSVRNERGQALIEMSLVLILLLMLLFGITEFGRLYYYNLTVSNAARAGARYASVTKIDTAGGQTQVQYNTALKQYIAERAFPGDAAKIAALKDDNPAGGNIVLSYIPSPRVSGSEISITVNYPVQIYAPIVSYFTGNPRTVSAKVIMRAE